MSTRALSAEFYRSTDYFFTNEGILVARIVSPAFQVLLPFAIWAITIWGVLISPYFALPSVLSASFIAHFVVRERARRRRKALSTLPVEELVRHSTIKRLIPWSEIKKVEIKGRNLSIWINGKKLEARAKNADIASVVDFIKSRTCDRINVVP